MTRNKCHKQNSGGCPQPREEQGVENINKRGIAKRGQLDAVRNQKDPEEEKPFGRDGQS